MDTRRKPRKNVKKNAAAAAEASRSVTSASFMPHSSAAEVETPRAAPNSQQPGPASLMQKEDVTGGDQGSLSSKDDHRSHQTVIASRSSYRAKGVQFSPASSRQRQREKSTLSVREAQALWLVATIVGALLMLAGIGTYDMKERLDKAAITTTKLEDDAAEAAQKQLGVESRLTHVEKALSTIFTQFETLNYDEISSERVGDAIWELVRNKVEEKVLFATGDSTGLADYALSSAGGQVVGHSKLLDSACIFPNHPMLSNAFRFFSKLCLIFGIATIHPRANEILLQPGSYPGQCLPLEGTSGQVDIRLRAPIFVSSVSLEQVPRSIAYTEQWASAPKVIHVLGHTKSSAQGGRAPHKMTTLLKGEFDIEGNSVQTFPSQTLVNVSHIRIQVLSNHGHPGYTCLYRIRVHGNPGQGIT